MLWFYSLINNVDKLAIINPEIWLICLLNILLMIDVVWFILNVCSIFFINIFPYLLFFKNHRLRGK